MPVFEYTALNRKGKKVSGIINAESSVSARLKLRSSEIFPTAISEVHDVPSNEKIKEAREFLTRVKPVEITMMTRQLATLTGAGFPLVTALNALISQTTNNVFKKKLSRVKESIVEGNTFAAALSLYPEHFSPLYINMTQAGESSGTLEIVLDRLADIMEKQQALKNRVQTALAYPVFMLVIGTIVLFVLLAYIVPGITTIFEDMNQTLPAPTRFLISLSSFAKSYWWAIVTFFGMVFLSFRWTWKNPRGKKVIDKILISLPVAGVLVRKLGIARFSRTLGTLLENGVSMLVALGIVKNIAGNEVIATAVESTIEDVGKGQGVGAALSTSSVFPNLSIQMIQVGEQSGALEMMLYKIADVYENEAESDIMRMTVLLEPIMILVMGLVVLFIVLSICLPIFEMNQLVR
jgi:general secretion pathway protein F